MKRELDWDFFVGFGESIGCEEIDLGLVIGSGVGEGIGCDE